MSHTQGQSFDKENQSTAVEWFVRNQRSIFLVIILALVAVCLSVWWMSNRKKQEIKDFEQAEILAKDLQSAEAADLSETVQDLKAIDDKYPVLQRRYDGILAQEFIALNDQESIDPYAKRAIEQLRSVCLDNFATYSEVSRLIAKNELEGALTLATSLQKDLEAESSEQNYALQAFTLLDIATLNKKLGRIEEEKQALTSLSTLFSSDTNQETKDKVLAILQENESTLLDYMQRT